MNALPICKNCNKPHGDHVPKRLNEMTVQQTCPPPCTTQYEPQVEAIPEMTDAGLSLKTFKVGIAVDVQDNSHAPEENPHGCISIGPAHVPGIGPVILMTVPDGTTQIVTMNSQGFGAVGSAFNQAARRIMAGEFDEPETKQ